MRLQTKFILTLLSATLLAFISAQIVQQVLRQKALNALSRENLDLLEQRELLHAENIYQTIDPIVQETITQGEMPKIDALMNSLHNIDGLLEYSIYDNKGVAAYSSSVAILKARKPIASDVKTQVFGNPAKFTRRTAEAFEIYKPMVVTASCIGCHENFKKDTIGAVALLRFSTNTLVKSKQSWTVATGKIQQGDVVASVSTTLLVVLILSLLSYFTVKHLVALPLRRSVEVLDIVSEGDLTPRLAATSQDEIGHMGRALNRTLDKLSLTIGRIGENAVTLATSSEQLNSLSHSMMTCAAETSSQAQTVSQGSDQVSRNVQMVAASTEEMTVSVGEIAKNASEAVRVATAAVNLASESKEIIGKLTQSSADIGHVVEVIASIARQTNLLALNAAIEAARAGDAGLGFAVVASEVKELARETAAATDDIGSKITAIQTDTGNAIKANEQITEIIHRINEFQNIILSSVEEQSATTSEMSRNIAEAARGTAGIAESIGGVAGGTAETTKSANLSSASAADLSRMAAELNELVGQFKYQNSGSARTLQQVPATSAFISGENAFFLHDSHSRVQADLPGSRKQDGRVLHEAGPN